MVSHGAEVLKQRLDALVVAVEATEEKAAVTRHRVLAARQLLDEEQAITANLEWQGATKKLVPRSKSFSTTETTTTSSSYVNTIITNLHI
jgi:DNA replication protein DnaD